MHPATLSIVFAIIHFTLVIVTFLCFGIGLEGKQHAGHLILWVLLMPAALIPLPGFVFIPLNSLLWGFCLALLIRVFQKFFH